MTKELTFQMLDFVPVDAPFRVAALATQDTTGKDSHESARD